MERGRCVCVSGCEHTTRHVCRNRGHTPGRRQWLSLGSGVEGFSLDRYLISTVRMCHERHRNTEKNGVAQRAGG